MSSSNMGHQAARAQAEGTIETRPSFAPHQSSYTSHPSNSSPPTSNPAMPSRHTSQSKANPRSRREAQSSESSSSSKATTSVWSPRTSSPKPSTPQSPDSSLLSSNPDSIELGVDPTTLLTAYTLDHPSSLEKLRAYIDVLQEEFASEDCPSSQYLLVRQIPADLFSILVQESELVKGARVTVLHHEHEILYKIMPGRYHERIIHGFTCWMIDALGDMGLRYRHRHFWFEGAGQATGRLSNKEADNTFFPGNQQTAGSQWPSLVFEIGISESMSQLRTDARWWYSNSNHQTKLVVLICANSNSNVDVDIEIWTEVNNQRVGTTNRNQPTHVLECTQRASLENGQVSGGGLQLDFETLMRRQPQNQLETNLQLTPSWIQQICDSRT